MKRLLFIYNPHAGKGMAQTQLGRMVDIFTKEGYLVTVWPTQGKADATRAAAEQGAQYDRVVCCGGDGTLNETVTGLLRLEHPPALGYIPAGTTNDFAKNLSLPRGIEKMARAAVTGPVRACDMGLFNGRNFVYVAAFGLFTDVSYATPQSFKNAFGHLAYVLEGATKLGDIGKGYRVTVERDGEVIDGEFIYGMVSNTRSVGGFQVFPPREVALDDGLFEVVLVRKPETAPQLQETLLALALQDPGDSGGQVVAFHTDRLTFRTEEELSWTLDGEYGGAPKQAEIQNHRQCIDLVWGK